MNIGVDYHDTLTYNPEFFKVLFDKWKGVGKIFIITGTPGSQKESIISALDKLGFAGLYTDIIMGFEYDKTKMDYSHFIKMRYHKLDVVKANDIQIYYDDNPFYVEYIRDFDVTVFQTILDSKYIRRFAENDPFFTCNLQDGQFNFLKKYDK